VNRTARNAERLHDERYRLPRVHVLIHSTYEWKFSSVRYSPWKRDPLR
jgi:hypothetical protein